MLELLIMFSIGLNIFQHLIIKRQRNFARAARALVSRR
jgi:hypothetical protein